MVVSPTAPETTRRRRSRQPPAEPVWTDTLEALETLYVARPPSQSLEPETISSQWRVALDAAESALSAAVGAVPASELARRRARLVQERLETAKALTRLARVTSVLGEDHASVALRGRRWKAHQDLHVVLEDGAAPHGRRVAERALLHSQRDRLSEEADGRRPRQGSCLRTRKDRRRRFLGPPAQRHG
jgi:hypothetical protein